MPACSPKQHSSTFLPPALHSPLRWLIPFCMAGAEEELQRLYSDDDDDVPPRARPAAGKSRCPTSCDAGIMLLPLPCASEVRISVSPSTPTRRRNFLLALAACDVAPSLSPSQTLVVTALAAALAVYLIWQYIKNRKPYYEPFDWTPDYSVQLIPNAPLRSNERTAFFTQSSPGLSCSGQMDWDPSRSSPHCASATCVRNSRAL